MSRIAVALMLGAATHVGIADAADEPPQLDSDSVKSGRAVYRQYCASCHGANAEGAANWQERDQHGELPAPPHDAQGHTWRHSDGELYDMVSEGWRGGFNKTKRRSMAGVGGGRGSEQI